jgi:cytochrome c-type biogenesis protein CcmF
MVELGEYALYLTLPFTVFALFAALSGAKRQREEWAQAAERAVHVVFALLCLAILGLEWAFLTDRFDLAYVARHSSLEQPVLYKLALWGGQEGSLLLWAWLLAVMTAFVVFQNRGRNRVLMPWVIVSQMANLLFFTALTCTISNPFESKPAEMVLSNGSGMNPILQHVAMLIHPPSLYLGFVGFSVPFSFAFAALATGELSTSWFQATRRWTLVAWFFLSVGLILGGRWAYEVLGWGGYWAWDPVENASLMPWLTGTAFLHSVMIQEKRGMLKIWNMTLIGLTYSLCLFGTFLTRSGVVQSVHSFASAGWFGLVFLAYVAVVAVCFASMLVWRAPQLRSTTRLDSVLSREGSFLLNNYVFLGLLAITMYGTLSPVFSEALLDQRLVKLAPWFEFYSGPLALMLLILTGVGPLIAWRRASWTNLRKSFLWPAATAALCAVALAAGGMRRFYPLTFLTLCTFVAATIIEEYGRGIRARMRRGENPLRACAELMRRNQRRYGGYVVHLAIVLMFIGFAGSAFDLETTKLLRPGERWDFASYTIEYRQPQPVSHPHYGGAIARLALYEDGEPVSILKPEKRVYFQQEQQTSIPAVSSRMHEDFYVILSGLEADQSAALKIYINPLVNWLWLGSCVFVVGCLLILWRVPEPRREREGT